MEGHLYLNQNHLAFSSSAATSQLRSKPVKHRGWKQTAGLTLRPRRRGIMMVAGVLRIK